MVVLDKEEKGILRYLGKEDEGSVPLKDITNYLSSKGYNLPLPDVEDKLDHLIDVGYVRSRTEGKGSNRVEKFYLSNLAAGLLGGVGKKRSLQGRGIKHDLKGLLKRAFGSIFLVFGVGLFLYDATLTGAVISSSGGLSSGLVLPVFLFVAGGALLVNSFIERH